MIPSEDRTAMYGEQLMVAPMGVLADPLGPSNWEALPALVAMPTSAGTGW